MSPDCEFCWDCPCTCGTDKLYRMSNTELYNSIVEVIRVLTIKNSSPLQPIIDKIIETCHCEKIY